MRLTKKLLSAFLALVMVFTMLPVQAFASETVSGGTQLPVQKSPRPSEGLSDGGDTQYNYTIRVGETIEINSNKRGIIWNSDPDGVVEIKDKELTSAKITGIAPGVAKITHRTKKNDKSETFLVKVLPVVDSLTLNKDAMTLTGKQTEELTATPSPTDAQVTVEWTSTDPNVATVDAQGNVTSVGVGTATITATASGTNTSASCEVAVREAELEGISLAELSLAVGKTGKMPITYTPAEPLAPQLGWKVNDKNIAEIAADGTITAKEIGETTVTVTCGDLTGSAELTVTDIVPESITLNAERAIIQGLGSVQLTATVLPEDAEQAVTWQSSNEEAATVDETGKVQAVGIGSTTITATTVNGLQAHCDVGVEPLPVQGNTPVYVYLKLELAQGVAPDGWTPNDQGWYTVGRITVPADVLPNATKFNETADARLVLGYLSQIELHSDNANVIGGISLGDCTNWQLHVQSNASSYPEEQGRNTWHLDGWYRVEDKNSTLTVRYEDEYGNELHPKGAVYTYGPVKNGTSVEIDIPSIDNYTLWKIAGGVVDDSVKKYDVVVSADKTITITYKGNSRSYQVKYIDSETNQEIAGVNSVTVPSSYGATINAGEVLKEHKQEIPHYTYDRISPENLVVQNNTGLNIFNLYYTRDKYAVTYEYTHPVTGEKVTIDSEEYGAGLEVTAKPALDISGYTFSGWKDKAEENKVVIDGNGKFTMPDRPVVFSGTLTKQKFTVNYVAENGGTVDPTSETVPYDENAKGSEATPNKGYYFVGWKNKDNVFESHTAKWGPTNVTADATYTAVFARKTEITVKANDLSKEYDGTPITAENATYTANGLLEDYTLDVTYATESAPINVNDTPGTLKIASVTVKNEEGQDVTDQFQITTNTGTLSIKPKPVTVTITGNTDETKTYNGSEQSVVGYEVKIPENSGYSKESITFDGAAIAKGTDVGTYFMDLPKKQFGNNDPNYNVTFKVHDGHLTIGPVTDRVVVTIVGNNNTVTYDGEPHTASGYDVKSIMLGGETTNLYKETDVGLANGATAEITQTNANIGEEKYSMGLTASSFKNNSKNFTNVEFVVTDGYLKINPAEVTVTIKGNQETKTYNGSEQSVETGYTATPSNAQYNTEKITFSGEQTVAGTDHDTYPMGLANNQFSNTDTNYSVTFNVQDGSLTINKLPVTVTAQDINVAYGKPVENLTATKSAADGVEIPDNFDSVVTYTLAHDGGETPNVGEYPIYFKIGEREIKKTETDKDSYQNYEVTFVTGTLTINKAGGLTVSGTDVTKEYNGQSHGVAATASVKEGTTIFYKVGDGGWTTTVPQIMDAGTVTVEVKAENPNYTTATDKYTLKVTPRDVTLTSASDSKTYDGTALTNNTVRVSGDGFVEGEGATYDVTGSQTLVGSSDNTFTYTLNKGTLATNYNIQTVLGTLTVEAPEDFDYVQKKFKGQKFAIGDTVTFTITVTNIYDVPATVVLEEQTGMTFADGKTELTDMLDAGETKTYSVSYEVTEADVEAGQIANKVTWTLTPKDLPEIPGTDEEIIQNPKYKVSYNVSGETPVGYTSPEDADYPIGKSVSVAEMPSYPGYTFTGWTAPEDITVNEGKFAMPEKNVTLTGVFALAGDTKYKVEHYFAKLDGQYPATPKKTENKTGTTFDMTQAQPIPEDQRPGFGVVDSWANEEIKPDGSTVIKIYYNRKEYKISWETSGEPAGQEQTFNPANFVYGADISKVKNPEVEQFDGYTWNGWQIRNENMLTLPGTMPAEDIVITGSYTPIDYEVTYQLAEDSEIPTGYTAPEDNAKYHIGDNVTVKDDARVPGYNFEGWYTEDGNVTADMSTFTMPADNVTLYGKFSKRTDLAYTVNYIWNGTVLETVPGTGTFGDPVDPEVKSFDGYTFKEKDKDFTITADPSQNVVNVYYYKNVTLTANNDERTYNGETQTAKPGYVSSETNAVFEGIVLTGSGKDAKKYHIAFPENTLNTVDETEQYIVADVKDGTLTINKRQVALESESGEQVYNGTALTNSTVTIDGDDFVEGDVTEVKATGTQTLVGESDNTIEITWEDETVAGNYKISKKEGKLIVKAPDNLNDYVVKTHEGQNFKVGDKVTFNISVTNIYAVNAKVTLEEKAGMTFENGLTTLGDVLNPGQTKTYTATRTLTDADFENGGVDNTVKVTLTPERGDPTDGTDTDKVVLVKNPDMSVVKTVLNPKESYRVGDTIQYQIIVTNTGNVTLHDLELTDVMNADGKVTFPAGTDLTRETLNVGDSWTVTCSYVVREADEGKEISNKATVIAHDPETKDPEKEAGDTTDGEQVQNLYSLTIHYRNGAGNAVAGSYSARYHVGDSFKIVSPIVAGYYDPQIRSISPGPNGMPAQDLEYVVIYTAIPVPAPDPGPGPAPNPGPGPGPAPNPGPDDGDDDDDTPPVPNPEQEQPPQPQDFEIDPDDYTLTELEDNETPLANLDLDGHTCCILHLLLMLAAMVVLGFYTKSRKKHQARIFELKRILAAEEDHPDDPQQP